MDNPGSEIASGSNGLPRLCLSCNTRGSLLSITVCTFSLPRASNWRRILGLFLSRAASVRQARRCWRIQGQG